MCGSSDRPDPGSGPYWLVELDVEKCSLCEVCVRRCPTHAIRSELEGDILSIFFRPGLCDGCRRCADHCPEEAIRIIETGSPPRDSGERVLARSGMLRCSVCGAYFAPVRKLTAVSRKGEGSGEQFRDACPLCRRTHIVVGFIEEKRKVSGKAEYRTGKKWKWKPVTDDSEGPPCREP